MNWVNCKYKITYSLEGGQIGNTVGCHTPNQAKEIARLIYDGYQKTSKVDFVTVFDENDKVMLVLK